jgi:hypothetical protein
LFKGKTKKGYFLKGTPILENLIAQEQPYRYPFLGQDCQERRGCVPQRKSERRLLWQTYPWARSMRRRSAQSQIPSSASKLARCVRLGAMGRSPSSANVTSSTLSIISPYSSASMSVAVGATEGSARSQPPLLPPFPRCLSSRRGGGGEGGSSSNSHIEEDSCECAGGSGCEADEPSASRSSPSKSNASCAEEVPRASPPPPPSGKERDLRPYVRTIMALAELRRACRGQLEREKGIWAPPRYGFGWVRGAGFALRLIRIWESGRKRLGFGFFGERGGGSGGSGHSLTRGPICGFWFVRFSRFYCSGRR